MAHGPVIRCSPAGPCPGTYPRHQPRGRDLRCTIDADCPSARFSGLRLVSPGVYPREQATARGSPHDPCRARTTARGPSHHRSRIRSAAVPAGCSRPCSSARRFNPGRSLSSGWLVATVTVPTCGVGRGRRASSSAGRDIGSGRMAPRGSRMPRPAGRVALHLPVVADGLKFVDDGAQLVGPSVHADDRLAVVVEEEDVDVIVGVDQL